MKLARIEPRRTLTGIILVCNTTKSRCLAWLGFDTSTKYEYSMTSKDWLTTTPKTNCSSSGQVGQVSSILDLHLIGEVGISVFLKQFLQVLDFLWCSSNSPQICDHVNFHNTSMQKRDMGLLVALTFLKTQPKDTV
jgi:hypothetical protein